MISFRSPGIGDIPMFARVFSSYRGEICDMTPANVVMWRDYYGSELAHEESEGGEVLYLRYAVDPDIDPDSFPDARARAYSHEFAYACPKVYFPGDENAAADGIPHAGEVKKAVMRLVEGGARFFCCLSWEERGAHSVALPRGGGVAGPRLERLYLRHGKDDLARRKASFGSAQPYKQVQGDLSGMARRGDMRSEHPRGTKVHRRILCRTCRRGKDRRGVRCGARAIEEVLSHWTEYGQEGILLYAGDAVAAFTFGEVTAGMLDIHIEKADRAFPGAYPAVFREFAAHFEGRAVTVNREEDCGEPGLRQSKLSYHPIRLAEKYNLVI